ncbi:MAG: class I SAM-dependent methyltransferase [Chloroflexaceae bacterium]|nr:class I SAM-dependent methyltransferase [Chloroflexaceae bacterium]NJL35121.1 class I SAM-dependent methyltransferase [Chloroflexaceae bacterium]
MQITIGAWRIAIEQITPEPHELGTIYDRVATQWERSLDRLRYPQAYRSFFRELRRCGQFNGLPINAHVLDCGIGTGALSSAFLQQCASTVRLTGVDISSGMLQVARRTLTRPGISTVLYQQDVCNLQFPDNTFDIVMGAHILEHLPDPSIGLREMVRVLRPGAPLVIVVTRMSLFSLWLCLRWSLRRTDPSHMLTMMQAVGLKDVRVYRFMGLPWCNWMSIACVGIKA